MNKIKFTEKTGPNPGIVSLDFAKHTHYAYLCALTGEDRKPFPFRNDREGLNKLWRMIEAFCTRYGLSGVIAVGEPTGSYGLPAMEYLRSRGCEMRLVNPMHTKKLKELEDNSPEKNDAKDTRIIAQALFMGYALHYCPVEGAAAELRSLTHNRERQMGQITRLRNILEGLLSQIFPEYLMVMKGLRGKTAIRLLAHCCTPQEVTRMKADDLYKLIHKFSQGRLNRDRAEELRKAASGSIGIQYGLTGICIEIRQVVEKLLMCFKQVETIEIHIDHYLAKVAYAPILTSVKGIGNIIAAGLIGEVGDFHTFGSSEAIIKLAGLNLYGYNSGTRKSTKKISRRGRTLLRKYLYLAAVAAVRWEGAFRDAHQRYKAKGKKGAKALMGVCRKLVRVLWALISNETFYDPQWELKRDKIKDVVNAA